MIKKLTFLSIILMCAFACTDKKPQQNADELSDKEPSSEIIQTEKEIEAIDQSLKSLNQKEAELDDLLKDLEN